MSLLQYIVYYKLSDDSDLISCDIIQKDGTWQHRFLAVDNIQIILVEPDKQRLGWGVAKLVGSLQDLEVTVVFNFLT